MRRKGSVVLLMFVSLAAVQDTAPPPQGRRSVVGRRLREARTRGDLRALANAEALLALLERDAGHLDRAEAAAERAAVWGGEGFQRLRDEILGLCAWSRSLEAEDLALQPEAGAPAWDAAILHARSARDHWVRAATAREPSRRALRNAERAWSRMNILSEKKAALAKKKKRVGRQGPRPAAPRDSRTPGIKRNRLVKARQTVTRLSAWQLSGLRRLLRRKEAERKATRETLRRANRHRVEKDW